MGELTFANWTNPSLYSVSMLSPSALATTLFFPYIILPVPFQAFRTSCKPSFLISPTLKSHT